MNDDRTSIGSPNIGRMVAGYLIFLTFATIALNISALIVAGFCYLDFLGPIFNFSAIKGLREQNHQWRIATIWFYGSLVVFSAIFIFGIVVCFWSGIKLKPTGPMSSLDGILAMAMINLVLNAVPLLLLLTKKAKQQFSIQ